MYRLTITAHITAPDPEATYRINTIAKSEQVGETKVLLDLPMVGETIIKAALAQIGVAVKTHETVVKQTALPAPKKMVEPEGETESENE